MTPIKRAQSQENVCTLTPTTDPRHYFRLGWSLKPDNTMRVKTQTPLSVGLKIFCHWKLPFIFSSFLQLVEENLVLFNRENFFNICKLTANMGTFGVVGCRVATPTLGCSHNQLGKHINKPSLAITQKTFQKNI